MKRNSFFMVAGIVTVALMLVMTSPAMAASWHTVRAGESLWTIAHDYGTSVSNLEQASGLSGKATIYPGQQVLVTGPGEAVHWVRSGDSFYSIARAYGTTAEHLMNMNGRTSSYLAPGERIVVPVASHVTATASAPAAGVRATTGRTASLANWEIDLLARVVAAEARGEPYTGQVAVAHVILNRVASPAFPNSVYGVVYESHQFESVMNGTVNAPAGSTQRQAVLDALNGWDPSYGALYFWNPAKANNSFLWSRLVTVWIGNHQFAR